METEPQIIAAYIVPGKARLVYRHLVQLGEGAQLSAEASECAGAQGKFWELRQKLYAEQRRLFDEGPEQVATYVVMAGELGLDTAQFQGCMEQRQFRGQVERDFAAAEAEGVASRPVFDIAGERLIGAQSFAQFRQLLDAAAR